MGPADLHDILQGISLPTNENVLVGLGSPDDAGVYRMDDDTALVQSVDYFTPVLDDPYDYGQAAAANALSDIYAMGARPLTALNLLGFPPGEIPPETVAKIIQGGADKVRESGAVILGSHTVDDPEPKFGYAVVGIAHPDRLLTKAGAREGDVLMLTKPIGVGVLTTAIKKVDVPSAVVREVTEVMVHLNRVGQDLAPLGVRAATDITGFGLLGHAGEMARESGVRLRIASSSVPVIGSAWEYAERGLFPAGSDRNMEYVRPFVDFDAAVPELMRRLLADAMTSGGLLIAVPKDRVDDVSVLLRAAGTLAAAVIGEVLGDDPGRIEVTP